MTPFAQQIIRLYGKRGKNWLAALPEQINQIEMASGIAALHPASNLSDHYVFIEMHCLQNFVAHCAATKKIDIACRVTSTFSCLLRSPPYRRLATHRRSRRRYSNTSPRKSRSRYATHFFGFDVQTVRQWVFVQPRISKYTEPWR